MNSRIPRCLLGLLATGLGVVDLHAQQEGGQRLPGSGAPKAASSSAVNPADGFAMEGFASPPASDRPAVYGFLWPWGYSKEVLTQHLEQMKAQGVTSCLIYQLSPGSINPFGRKAKIEYGTTENREVPTLDHTGAGVPMPDMGPAEPSPWPWTARDMESYRHLAREAARLDIELGITEGPAGCGQVDLPEEYLAQQLVHSAIPVKGGARTSLDVPLPKEVGLQPDKKTPRYYRDVAVVAVPIQGIIPPESVIDLSGKMDVQGNLQWDAPPGDWHVLRFCQMAVQVPPNHFVAIDHLSTEALDRHWEQTIQPLLRSMTPEERKAFRFVECDSYEGKEQTWTARFAEEFRVRRGYDIMPWLPVLARRTVGDESRTRRFQRDYRLTISDLFADNHYGHHKALAKAAGLRFASEASGPHQYQTDVLKSLSRCDIPMGEFWIPGNHRGVKDERRFLLRDAAAAAHGYGLGEVLCEAFTGGNDPWQATPFRMKPCGDQAFCDGLTRHCIHGYSLSPWEDGIPGVAYWAGTQFNRYTTWWPQSHAFLDYLARCSYLLRQGVFAPDVAWFTGNGIGQHLMRKDMFSALYPPGARFRGLYDYDRVNADILLSRMSARDGRIVLPDGLSYRVMALDGSEPMSVPVLRKIAKMVEQGAVISGKPNPEPYGLNDDPEEFRALVRKIWGTEQPGQSGEHVLGKGKVIWGKPLLQILADQGVTPDFECRGISDKGRIDWIHRRTGDAEIYFVASLWQPVEQVECVFRVSGRVPELWDPVTGTVREAGAFRIENGRTTVPLRFEPCGSVFVVFRKPTKETERTGKNWTETQPLQGIDGPWTVQFDPAWFYPQPAGVKDARIVFEKLQDWTTRPEDAVKYYSGQAVYEKEFTASPSRGRVLLDLGEVDHVAEVHLNGKNLGVLWTKPYRVDVTDALRPGTNRLQIGVTNIWPNRLAGDAFLPEDQRRTKTTAIKYTQTTELFPSGLLGPVQLMTESK